MDMYFPPFYKFEERLTTSFMPDMYVGPLVHKVINISSSLKLIVDVDQYNVEITDAVPPKTISTYRIRLCEKKFGVVRPFSGQNIIFKKVVKSDIVNFHYAKFDISNFWVYSEAAKYVGDLRFVFEEPMDSNFESKIIVSHYP